MNKYKHNKINNINIKPAFTIIEVVLVLAIAGLIFLMVFIALPALQRNQRDTQRRQDVGKLIDAVARWQANNPGVSVRSTTMADVFIPQYIEAGGDTFRDPDGSDYVGWYGIVGTLPTQRKADSGRSIIYRYDQAKCDGSNTISNSGNNNIAFSIILEGGGVYCVNN